MPQLATAGIVYLMNAGLSMAAAQVIVYGSMVIATGYVSVKIAEQKMREMEADARRKARNRAQEIQNMQFGTVAPRRFIYGEMVVNGHLIFQETAGTDNKDLYRVVYLGEGPINAATEIYFNEVEQTLSGDLDGAGASVSSGSYSGYGTFRVGVNGNSGSSSSVVNLTANTSWTSNHKMTGNSWLAYKLIHNNEVWTQGIPQVRVKVQGRKIYDPRLDGGGVGGGSGSHRYDDDTTWVFSNNSALCVLDFLLNGMSVDPSDIDMAAMRAAADICDENVNIQLANGSNSTQARYTTNGVSFLNDEVIATLEQLLVPCHGTLVEEAGVLRLIVPKDSSSVVVGLTEDDIVSELNININSEVAGRINKVSGTFTDKDSDFQQTDFSPISSSSLIASDGREHLQQIDLSMITDEARAQRLASIVLKENSLTNTMELVLKPKFSYLKVMDVVTVTFEPEKLANVGTDSIVTTATKWHISSYQLTPDGAVKISLEEYADSSYAWDTADHDYLTRTALADGFIDTITAPTLGTPVKENFLDEAGNQVLAMRVPVTHGGHPNFTFTEIKLLKHRYNSSNVLQQTSTFESVSLTETESSVLFSGMSSTPPIGSSSGDYIRHSISARTHTENGKVSPEAVISQAAILSGGYINKDTTAPSVPTNVSADGTLNAVVVSWTNPSDIDLGSSSIYRNTSNNSGTSSFIGKSSGTVFTDSGLNNSQSFYYWVSSVDRVGNESAKVATGQVTTDSAPPAGATGPTGPTGAAGAAGAAGPTGATGPEGQSGLVVTLNGADIIVNNIDPRDNTSTVQTALNTAFLAANPMLSAMSDIPDDAVVWARFVNSADTEYAAGRAPTQFSARKWVYADQDWTDNSGSFENPAIFSPLVIAEEAVVNHQSALSITAQQLTIGQNINYLDGGGWKIGKTSYSDTADGLWIGNPAGSSEFALATGANAGSANEHGILFDINQTKLINPIIMSGTGSLQTAVTVTSNISNVAISDSNGKLPSNTSLPVTGISIEAVGGGGGGKGAEYGANGSNGISTSYVLTGRYLGASSATIINVTAAGGAGATTAAAWYGSAGEDSAFALGGAAANASFGDGYDGSKGSGGGGAGGRQPATFTSSTVGGSGGSAGVHASDFVDLTGYTEVYLTITLGSGGAGGASARFSKFGGDGGDGEANYQIQTSSLEQVYLSPYEPIGVGQTWSNFGSGSGRSNSVHYRNTTDQPIMVNFGGANGGAGTAHVWNSQSSTPSGTTGSIPVGGSGASGFYAAFTSVIVPVGGWYYLDGTTNSTWAELR